MAKESRKKILIIDSDPLLEELIHYHFSSKADIERISTFDQLLSADKDDYAMVIIDPDTDKNSGREMVEMLRGTAGTNVPILIAASPYNQSELVSCLESGATDFISRPFEISVLVSRITHLLEQ